eukprot:gene2953-biopygen2463
MSLAPRRLTSRPAISAASGAVFDVADGSSIPARRTSLPSSRRKVRPSMIVLTRPLPCISNWQPAASTEWGSAAIMIASNNLRAWVVTVVGVIGVAPS